MKALAASLPISPAHLVPAAVVLIGLLSLTAFAWHIDRKEGYRLTAPLQERFIFGVPWGSIIVLGSLTAIYLGIQDGFHHWNDPVVLPFRAWSLTYPVGVLLSGFTHAGPQHFLHNLAGTMVFAPIAEYVWSHYPYRTLTAPSSRWRFSTSRAEFQPRAFWERPAVRAFLLFPGFVVLAGVFTAAFSWGAVIGFSGVVFAFVGVAIVARPLTAVAGIVAQTSTYAVLKTLESPTLVEHATSTVSRPSWVSTALQAHVLGLLLGIAVAAALMFERRSDDERPQALHVVLSGVGVLSALSVYAFGFERSPGEYVMYRWLGMLFVLILVAAVAVAMYTDHDSLPYIPIETDHLLVFGLFLPVLLMALIAVPMNLTTVAGPSASVDGSVTEHGYEVGYAEDVPVARVTMASAANNSTGDLDKTASGVIVSNQERNIWYTPVSPAELERAGEVDVVVGGMDWRETITVSREGWTTVGGNTTYLVKVHTDETTEVSYQADAAQSEQSIAGRTIEITPNGHHFQIRVSHNGSEVGKAPVPIEGQEVDVGGFTFTREDGSLYVIGDGTRLLIAEQTGR